MYTTLDLVIPLLEERGYSINNPWDVVAAFEDMIANYAGSKYAVSVDNCTNALFLSLKFLGANGTITIPAQTYVSAAQSIIHAGCNIEFRETEWTGTYRFDPYPIVDGATRFRKGMYEPGTFHCLSFHIKKILSIGKGGMILTNDFRAVEWFKKARYEGRDISVPYESDSIDLLGWNMYMPPEQAAVGILKFVDLLDDNPDCGASSKYHDLRRHPLFKDKK
jgi:dTDP-4-amino-4,6-dideoxygalactose transaminase